MRITRVNLLRRGRGVPCIRSRCAVRRGGTGGLSVHRGSLPGVNGVDDILQIDGRHSPVLRLPRVVPTRTRGRRERAHPALSAARAVRVVPITPAGRGRIPAVRVSIVLRGIVPIRAAAVAAAGTRVHCGPSNDLPRNSLEARQPGRERS